MSYKIPRQTFKMTYERRNSLRLFQLLNKDGYFIGFDNGWYFAAKNTKEPADGMKHNSVYETLLAYEKYEFEQGVQQTEIEQMWEQISADLAHAGERF